MGKEQVAQMAGLRLTLKARMWTAVMVLVVLTMGTIALLVVLEMTGNVPALAQFGIWLVFATLAFWRVWRAGVQLTDNGVTIRGVFVDRRIPWEQVVDIAATESGNTVGVTMVPVIRTANDGYLALWLSGYSWRGENRRVRRQVGQMSDYWRQMRSRIATS